MMGTTILPALAGRLAGLNITQYRGARVHQTSANSTSGIIGIFLCLGKAFIVTIQSLMLVRVV